MPRHHIIISGTGRAGTTFLIQLLTVLGLDTGFSDITSEVMKNSNAGMEKDIRAADAPYIIKSPWLCDYLGEVKDVIIDHAIVPIRDLYSAAESRRDVAKRTDRALYANVPGGLWHTEKPEEQEKVLAVQLHKLLSVIAERDIPLTLLSFPRLVEDAAYLYEKLRFLNIPSRRLGRPSHRPPGRNWFIDLLHPPLSSILRVSKRTCTHDT